MPFDQTNYQPEPADHVLRCLIGARECLSDAANWCGDGAYNRTEDGRAQRCIVLTLDAIPHSMGALHVAIECLQNAGPDDIIAYNDAPTTTHADVLALFDRAIAARRAAVASGPA